MVCQFWSPGFGRSRDTTFRGWSATLAARVRLVFSRLVLIFALSLDSHGRVRVVMSMYIPAALHGLEASLLASDSLRKLRSLKIGFRWDPVGMGWSRLGLLLLSNLAGPVQHFMTAILDAWRNKVVWFMRFGTGPSCPGHLVFGIRNGFHVPASATCAEDIAHWPYTAGVVFFSTKSSTFLQLWLLRKMSVSGRILLGFWSSMKPFEALCIGLTLVLIWPVVESLIWSFFYNMSCGPWRGLFWRKLFPGIGGAGRPISVSAVPFGPGIDIWRSCRFIGALMRSLCLLHGGLGRLLPCSVGANHCRLRHIGWEKSGHGLTSRPRETASEVFLNELLGFLSVSSKVCPLRYWLVHCFSGIVLRDLLVVNLPGGCWLKVRLLGWSLKVRRLALFRLTPGILEVPGLLGLGSGKRVRLNRKTPAHLVRQSSVGVESRPRVWKRLGAQVFAMLILSTTLMLGCGLSWHMVLDS